MCTTAVSLMMSAIQVFRNFKRMAICKGMIIDVRDNGGGSLVMWNSLGRFFNEKTLIGYISHKMGPGHNDFSPLYQNIESYKGIRYQKPVVVLTNGCCAPMNL